MLIWADPFCEFRPRVENVYKTTHGHDHAVLLLVCAAAAEESDDKDDASYDDEKYGHRREPCAKEVQVRLKTCLYYSSSDDKAQPSKLKW